MIEYRVTNNYTDFFDARQDTILVCTVNCAGAMGAGIAKAFKSRFPSMFYKYRRQCYDGEIELGKITVYEEQLDISSGVHYTVVLLPTKQHWTDDSEIKTTWAGVGALSKWLKTIPTSTIHIPLPGAGLGGISEDTSREMLRLNFQTAFHNVIAFSYQPPRRPYGVYR